MRKIILILLGLFLTTFSCSLNITDLKNCSGNIYIFDNANIVYDVQSNTEREIVIDSNFSNFEFMCKKNDSVVVLKITDVDLLSPQYKMGKTKEDYLYYYNLNSKRFTTIDGILNDFAMYYSVDYDSNSKNFLISGILNGDWQIFLFDSDNNQLINITKKLDINKPILSFVLLINDSTILVKNDFDKIYTCNIDSFEKKVLDYKNIIGFSNDKRFLILSKDIIVESSQIIIYDLITHDEKSATIKNYYEGPLYFSPNNNFLAFFKEEGFLGDEMRLCIHEIESQKTIETELVVMRSLLGSRVLWNNHK